MTVSIDHQVPVEERYITFLRLFSTLFSVNLSEQDLNIVNEFFFYHGGVINTKSRRQVAERLKITEYNLNNYLRKLRKRNVVNSKAIHEKININIMVSDKDLCVCFNLKS